MKMARFAIDAPDIATAAERAGRAAGLPFEQRESDHYGPYCLIRLPGGGSIRVLENLDPVYRAELDPPEDKFFEPDFSAEQVLIEIDTLDATQLSEWKRIVGEVFPGAIPIDRPGDE